MRRLMRLFAVLIAVTLGAGAALARPPSRPVDDGESAADPDDRRAAVTVSEGEGEGAQGGGRIVRGDNGSK
jgi:hypothetical protein